MLWESMTCLAAGRAIHDLTDTFLTIEGGCPRSVIQQNALSSANEFHDTFVHLNRKKEFIFYFYNPYQPD